MAAQKEIILEIVNKMKTLYLYFDNTQKNKRFSKTGTNAFVQIHVDKRVGAHGTNPHGQTRIHYMKPWNRVRVDTFGVLLFILVKTTRFIESGNNHVIITRSGFT